MTTKDNKVVEQEAVDAKYDALNRFVDANVKKDEAAIQASISEYILAKAKDITTAMFAKPVTEDSEPAEKVDDKEDKYAAMAKNAKFKTRTKKKEPLRKMRKTDEAVVVEDSEPAEKVDDKEDKYAAMAGDAKFKTRTKAKKPLKKMKKTNESVASESPIRLKGDGVFVQGKQVGTLENDLSSVNSNIIFKEMEGSSGKKEFENLTDLYKHLVTKFDVQGESPLDDEGKVKAKE